MERYTKYFENAKISLNELPAGGIFLTGIESSDPYVGGKRRNQLREAFDFYIHHEARLRNIAGLGIKWLRFGPPYSAVHVGPDAYDFVLSDEVVKYCAELGIEIIADLLHFGLPEWLHAEDPSAPFFQNEKFPEIFAQYCGAFAKRYRSIRFFTVVNEPFITAQFSARLGIWNEQIATAWDDDKPFTRAAKNIARAVILGKREIERVWAEEGREGRPLFVQNESFEEAMAVDGSGREGEAARFNLRRFVALDLILGCKNEEMKKFLIENGLNEDEYSWFMENGNGERVILGIDHYPTCVHVLHPERIVDAGPLETYRLYEITKVYAERYGLPMLHTETNGWPDYAVSLCQKTYDAIVQLRGEGYPIVGMGWYGDEYQVGWHHALVGEASFKEESLVGLFYKG